MVSLDEFKKLDLRVAEVKDVKDHPNADKLLLLRIDVGGEEKQIIAGIRKHYSKDSLVGRKIVVINNLQPVTIRGETSSGMLLAAGTETEIVILVPERDVPAGTRIR